MRLDFSSGIFGAYQEGAQVGRESPADCPLMGCKGSQLARLDRIERPVLRRCNPISRYGCVMRLRGQDGPILAGE